MLKTSAKCLWLQIIEKLSAHDTQTSFIVAHKTMFINHRRFTNKWMKIATFWVPKTIIKVQVLNKNPSISSKDFPRNFASLSENNLNLFKNCPKMLPCSCNKDHLKYIYFHAFMTLFCAISRAVSWTTQSTPNTWDFLKCVLWLFALAPIWFSLRNFNHSTRNSNETCSKSTCWP